jgi:hypothetical protein
MRLKLNNDSQSIALYQVVMRKGRSKQGANTKAFKNFAFGWY